MRRLTDSHAKETCKEIKGKQLWNLLCVKSAQVDTRPRLTQGTLPVAGKKVSQVRQTTSNYRNLHWSRAQVHHSPSQATGGMQCQSQRQAGPSHKSSTTHQKIHKDESPSSGTLLSFFGGFSFVLQKVLNLLELGSNNMILLCKSLFETILQGSRKLGKLVF